VTATALRYNAYVAVLILLAILLVVAVIIVSVVVVVVVAVLVVGVVVVVVNAHVPQHNFAIDTLFPGFRKVKFGRQS
jgi:hypothetical protein